MTDHDTRTTRRVERAHGLDFTHPSTMERVRVLVRACHARMGRPLSRDELEDVVQSTAIATWRRMGTFSGRSSEQTWVFGIARLEILEVLRSGRRRTDLLRSVRGGEVGSVEAVQVEPREVDLEARVLERIRGLGTTAATILRRRLVDGQSYRRIARRIRLSESATKARFHRLLPRARARLAALWRSLEGPG